MTAHESFEHRARTKIVATVGPASRSPEMLAELVTAGVDVFRLNTAHGSRAEHDEVFTAIRRMADEKGEPIGILVDLAGPKIRLGELPGGLLECHAGETIRFIRGEKSPRPGELTTTYPRLIDELEVGDRVMLADAAVRLMVEKRTDDFADCRVIHPGVVRNRQGVNLPGVKLTAPAMSEADRAAAQWAAERGADFVSLSFVRSPIDVRELKRLLGERGFVGKVMAKIEKPEALSVLDEIVEEADAVMVARGDLGVEIDIAEVPLAQKRIVRTCARYQRPVIIATQMLDSMQHSQLPTRAEVTDIANAVLDGGDACMLSGETAIGNYPREAVEMLNRVARATEKEFMNRPADSASEEQVVGVHKITQAVVYGADHIVRSLRAKLLVVATRSGKTALAISKRRNFTPVIAVSESEAVLRQMALYWGVTPLVGVPCTDSDALAAYISQWGREHGYLEPGDLVVSIAGTGTSAHAHNAVEVHRVE